MPTVNTLGGKKPSTRPSKERWKKHDNFYSSTPWRMVRALQLKDFPLCCECEKEGKLTPAYSVDHIRPRRWWPELSITRSNLQSLCKSHHAKKSAQEQKIKSKEDYEIKFKL